MRRSVIIPAAPVVPQHNDGRILPIRAGAERIDDFRYPARPAVAAACRVIGVEERRYHPRDRRKRAGFDVGKDDGFLGLKSRQAVKAMQVKYGLPADSYPTAELLARMRGG